MSWIGAGFGAGVGFFIGGPIGAAVGGVVGNWLSDEEDTSEEEAQALFFAAMFSMAGKMAKADGKVSPEEIAQVDEFIKTELELDEEDRKAAIKIFNAAKSDKNSMEDYAKQFASVQVDPEVREIMYRLLFAIAIADDSLHSEEEALLQSLPSFLGLPPSMYRLLVEESKSTESSLHQCYELLGCSPDHSDEEVRRAYRNKAKEYHPDKIVSKGLAEGFVKYAEGQMKSINAAYSTIMEHRAA